MLARFMGRGKGDFHALSFYRQRERSNFVCTFKCFMGRGKGWHVLNHNIPMFKLRGIIILQFFFDNTTKIPFPLPINDKIVYVRKQKPLSKWWLNNCLENDKNASKLVYIFCSNKVQTEIRKLCISEPFKKILQLI